MGPPLFSKHVFSNCLYESNKFNFLLEQFISKEKSEHWAGLDLINFILTQAFALPSAKASSGVLENVCLHNRCCCYGKC